MQETANRIAECLRERLGAVEVDVQDESYRHVGHAGAREGGHYDVRVVSPTFAGKSLVERHKLVYEALGDVIDSVHALSIHAHAPGE